MFISANIFTSPGKNNKLSDIGKIFAEDMWVKHAELSAIKTFDNREHIVMTFTDNEMGYFRGGIYLLLKENPQYLMVVSFQVNHRTSELSAEQLRVVKNLIKSFKIEPKETDKKTKAKYMERVVAEWISD